MALIGTEVAGESWPPPSGQGGPGVKRYDTEINGVPTTLLLSDEDAKARGLLQAEAKKAAPVKKAAPAKKARAVPNKARTAANKRTEVQQKAWQRKK